ncbi:hypothetical protein YTPLAS18_01100 [Nitrospira sp.]|nr:hypothetical protein YTPLAS18_01100 [Nitrospira sp.]
MATTPYHHRMREIGRPTSVHRVRHRGLDLQIVGVLCMITGVALSVVSVFLEGTPLALFGTVVSPQMSGFVWALAAGLLLTIGHGFTFLHEWVWDMTLTTSGVLTAGIAMNGVTWGVTIAGAPAFAAMSILAVYLVWRRESFVTLESSRQPRALQRGRRE